MVLHATEQDADARTSPHTRAVPAFKVVVKAGEPTATEGLEDGYFPNGINYEAVKPIAATVTQSIDDQIAVLELLAEDDE